jgi:hypothetical protein
MISVAIKPGERVAVIVRSISSMAFLHLIHHPLGHRHSGLNIYPFGHSAPTPRILRRDHSSPVAFHLPCRAYSG